MLAAQRRTWGVEHPMTTEAMTRVAEELAAQGHYSEADTMLRDAIASLERTVGPKHNRMALALLALARVRAASGHRPEAEADVRRALAILETSDQPSTRWVGVMNVVLADLLARRGEKVESEQLFGRAASILRPLPPQFGPDFRAAYATLADHFAASNRSSDAAYFRRLAQGRAATADSSTR